MATSLLCLGVSLVESFILEASRPRRTAPAVCAWPDWSLARAILNAKELQDRLHRAPLRSFPSQWGNLHHSRALRPAIEVVDSKHMWLKPAWLTWCLLDLQLRSMWSSARIQRSMRSMWLRSPTGRSLPRSSWWVDWLKLCRRAPGALASWKVTRSMWRRLTLRATRLALESSGSDWWGIVWRGHHTTSKPWWMSNLRPTSSSSAMAVSWHPNFESGCRFAWWDTWSWFGFLRCRVVAWVAWSAKTLWNP